MALYAKNVSFAVVMLLIVMQLLSPVRATRTPKWHAMNAPKCSSSRCAEETLESLNRKRLVESVPSSTPGHMESYNPTTPGHSPSIGHNSPPDAPIKEMNWFISDVFLKFSLWMNTVDCMRTMPICMHIVRLASWCVLYRFAEFLLRGKH